MLLVTILNLLVLVSYGYKFCPDLCPMTPVTLPELELQAVFKPKLNRHNLYQISAARLERDYRAVRDYLTARTQRFTFWAE